MGRVLTCDGLPIPAECWQHHSGTLDQRVSSRTPSASGGGCRHNMYTYKLYVVVHVHYLFYCSSVFIVSSTSSPSEGKQVLGTATSLSVIVSFTLL